jgi:excisionase family DNA binding protein
MEKAELGRLMTCEEVAEALGLRVSTIRRMVLERRIATVRPSRRSVRIPEKAVRQIIRDGYSPAIPHGMEESHDL